MNETWQSIEMRGAAYFINKGAQVSFPVVTHCGYDFIADIENKLIRVNVKAATYSKGSHLITRSARTPLADCYLAFIREEDSFIELPGKFFAGKKTKVIPKRIIKKSHP